MNIAKQVGPDFQAGLLNSRTAAARPEVGPYPSIRQLFGSFGRIALGTALSSAALATDWPQFRGPGAAGVAATARPPEKIGPNDNVLWKVAVPWSPSSPCVSGDRIFLTTFNEGQLEVRSHGTKDGKLLWSRAIKPESIEDHHRLDGSPAASTCATDGRRVVSYFGSFGLICHDVDGKELWRHPLSVAQSGGRFGTGTSPIIVGDTVLLNRDQHQYSTLLALELATGKIRWETPRPESSGSFGSPAFWRNNGVDEVVLAGTAQLKGYDFRTGTERWTITNVTGTVCTTPIVGDGMLFFAAWSPGQPDSPRPQWEKFLQDNDKDGDGAVAIEELPENRRDFIRSWDRDRDGKITTKDWERIKAGDARADNVLIAVKPGGTGDITESHVAWKYRKALPYVPTPLYYDGRLYFIKDGGLMSSLDPKTGEAFYAQERINTTGNYYSSPVAADGRIYVASLPGKISVIKAGGTKPEVLHQADFGARIFATPALVGDRIYLRTQTDLWAFGAGGKQ